MPRPFKTVLLTPPRKALASMLILPCLCILSPVWAQKEATAQEETAAPVTGLREDGSIDHEKVRSFYLEGEFDKVKIALEEFRKVNPSASVEDMLFIYKYLGVVYAAEPDGREKAESYLYQMLKLERETDLRDMFISQNVEEIYRTVKARYESMNPGTGAKPEEKAPVKNTEEKSGKSKRWVWWAAGGAAVASVVTVFIVMSGDEENPRTVTLPAAEL